VRGEDDGVADDCEETTVILNARELKDYERAPAKDRHLLVRIQGWQIGNVVTLTGKPMRVGRRQECELWLNEPGISREHARIVPDLNGYVLEDLNSSNGSFIHGAPVTRRRLVDGDVVQFGPLAAFRYSITDSQQEQMLRQLYASIVTDALTGAYNREHFDQRLSAELSYARRHKSELSLIMFDIDHFKSINDRHGHPAGDHVLREVSRVTASTLRSEDVFARYGGEEFAVILRNIDLDGAHRAGERVRANVSALNVDHEGTQIRVTVSAGCATLKCCPEPSRTALIALADRRLYAAKRGGRDRIVASD
jgi:diguanylate cyclase (GGDEF)-like protein